MLAGHAANLDCSEKAAHGVQIERVDFRDAGERFGHIKPGDRPAKARALPHARDERGLPGRLALDRVRRMLERGAIGPLSRGAVYADGSAPGTGGADFDASIAEAAGAPSPFSPAAKTFPSDRSRSGMAQARLMKRAAKLSGPSGAME